MKRYVIALFCLVSFLVHQHPAVLAQQAAEEIPFDSVPNFFKLPENLYFGECAGVAVNKAGHIFVYTRKATSGGHINAPQAASVLEFAADGTFVREIKDLWSMAWAHAVRFDSQDNMWLVDNGSDMVVKLSPTRKVELVLGRRRESVAATVPAAADGAHADSARHGRKF